TIRFTDRAFATTMRKLPPALAATRRGQAPPTGWTSAARAATRCSTPERIVRVAATAPVLLIATAAGISVIVEAIVRETAAATGPARRIAAPRAAMPAIVATPATVAT